MSEELTSYERASREYREMLQSAPVESLSPEELARALLQIQGLPERQALVCEQAARRLRQLANLQQVLPERIAQVQRLEES